MLVPFTVDPDVFSNSGAPREMRRKHLDLLRLWGQVGHLVIPGEKESESRLLQEVLKAPHGIQVLWRTALRQYRKSCGPAIMDLAIKSDAPPAGGEAYKTVQLISLDDTRAELWGVPEDEFYYVLNGGNEICRFGDEAHARAFKQSLAIASSPIAAGEPVSAVWNTRFSALCSASRIITVVDRYSIKSFLENSGGLSGLERFLLKVADLSSPAKKSVHVLASYSLNWGLAPSAQDFKSACVSIAEVFERVCAPLRAKGLREVHLHIAPDAKYGRIDHYRYVRFDDRNLITLDTGLEPLAGNTVPRTCLFALSDWTSESSAEIRSDEKNLRSVVEFQHRIDCDA